MDVFNPYPFSTSRCYPSQREPSEVFVTKRWKSTSEITISSDEASDRQSEDLEDGSDIGGKVRETFSDEQGRKEQSKSRVATFAREEEESKTSSSLILSLERTLFSSLSTAWVLALGGVGLMAIGNTDRGAVNGGITLICSAMILIALAFLLHVWRLYQMVTHQQFRTTDTLIWTALVCLLMVSTLGCELYFGLMYPYLQRTASVAIENSTSTQGP